MDGTTEAIIVVIGNPIAGNPSQFAVERALRSLGLDWRVLSFDVKPDDISAALEGFSVTGIAGVLVDPSVSAAASSWYAGKRSADQQLADETSGGDSDSGEDLDGKAVTGPPVVDCLYRDEDQNLVGSCEHEAWVDQRVAGHVDGNRILLGDGAVGALSSRIGLAGPPTLHPPDPDQIADAQLIVIANNTGGPVELEVEDWPANDGSTLVLDLTEGHPDQAAIGRRGYCVVTRMDRRIGTLQGCLRRWTGKTPSQEVIQDAIEEYLGV